MSNNGQLICFVHQSTQNSILSFEIQLNPQMFLKKKINWPSARTVRPFSQPPAQQLRLKRRRRRLRLPGGRPARDPGGPGGRNTVPELRDNDGPAGVGEEEEEEVDDAGAQEKVAGGSGRPGIHWYLSPLIVIDFVGHFAFG